MAGNYDRTYLVGIFSLNLYITYKLMFNFLKQEIMRKLLLLAPIAVLALASCSNDEQIAQSPALNAQELTFRPIVNGATRTVTTDANFDKFHVVATITNDNTKYAFWPTQDGDVAPTSVNCVGALTSLDLDVVKNAGKWEWLGIGEANASNYKTWYWSSKNAEASFQAYNVSNTAITIPVTVDNQKDILVAYNKGVASSFDNGVPLLFRHVLSQIVIKADNKDADIRQIKVAGVRLHNINNTSTLTLPTTETTADKFKWYDGADGYNPWSTPTSTVDNTKDLDSKFTYYKKNLSGDAVAADGFITLNATAQEITFAGPVLLLPQTVAAATDLSSENAASGKAYFDILVQVQNIETNPAPEAANVAIFPKAETASAQKWAWVAVPVDIAWNPGYKYTYVLHFSKDGIGKVSPDGGEGGEEPTNPGEEIVDNPVPLYFTVTIDEWNDAAKIEKDL